MKNLKHTLLILLLSFFAQAAHSQCIPDQIVFKTQQDIDNFAINYPNCSIIEGTVAIIADNSDITNLDGLSNITTIQGDFFIQKLPLSTLSPLENLTTVGGYLEIRETELISLAGLDNLESVTDLNIIANFNLTSISALNKLTTISNLFISSCLELTSLVGLENISNIENISFLNCAKIASIDGLSGLQSVSGNFSINEIGQSTSLSGLENLTTIGGKLNIQGNYNLLSLSGLEGLTSIGGDLSINGNKITTLNGLNNLTSIGGQLKIQSNKYLTTLFALNNINPASISATADSDIEITYNDKLSICNIESICQVLANPSKTFEIHDNAEGCNNEDEIDCNTPPTCLPGELFFTTQVQVDNFPFNYPGCGIMNGDITIKGPHITSLDSLYPLTEVKGKLRIAFNEELTSLKGLDNLTSVGDLILTYNSILSEISSFKNLTSVKGRLDFNQNNTLTNLHGLEGLSKIDGSLILISGKLNDISALQNITEIGGSLLFALTSFTSAHGVENLTSIGEDFEIAFSKISNLDPFYNLTSIGGTIKINNDDELTNINGIKNINPQTIEGIHIKKNPKLALCSVESVCGALAGASETDPNLWEINNNADGCNSIEELNCFGTSAGGTVYYDENQNGQKDTLEFGIAGQFVEIESGTTPILTNTTGRYFANCTAGTNYTFSLLNNTDWNLTSTTNPYNFTFSPNDPNNIKKDFGIYPTFSAHQLSSSIASQKTRCNENVAFYLKATNEGTFTENGHITATFEPNIQFLGATPPPDNVENNTVSWNFTDLHPWQHINFRLFFKLPPGEDPAANATVSSVVYYDENGTSNVGSETYTYNSPILCSFDPNDKLVTPFGLGDEKLTLKNSTLNYTIRFQNTGNSYAKDVVIRDTLSPDLDWNSFKVRSSSHDLKTTLSSEGLVTFSFQNIYLVDSTESYNGSQGYVNYIITPKPDLPEGTTINNTGYIFFDFNPAVVTNTATNKLVSTLTVATQEIPAPVKFSLYPNPTSGRTHILVDNYSGRGVYEIVLSDFTGKTIRIQSLTNQKAIDLKIGGLQPGMYFVGLKDFNTGGIIHVEKLLVE